MKFKTKLITYKLLFLFSLFFVVSCETTELELVDNPNKLAADAGNVDFYINSVQLKTAEFFQAVNDEGMETTRMVHMFGPFYENAYGTTQFDYPWKLAYSTILSDVRAMTPRAVELEYYTHVAVAQILEAYVMTTVVDYFGDVPYTEAINPEFLNPKTDSGASIYAALQLLLDDAIVNLNKEEKKGLDNDLFYNGDESKWIKLANTLKLKLYVQSRLVNEDASRDGINTIIADGNYIMSSADDFVFQYSTDSSEPDSRHPVYALNFGNDTGVNDYMSNQYMTKLISDKSMEDPRLRYYIYRQRDHNADNTDEQDCYGTFSPTHYPFGMPYCTTDYPGYWGRDHGTDSGIPPDTALRACWGLYPVGGPFDGDNFVPSTRDCSTKGAGISPIMLSSFVDFMLAESAYTLGTTGDALAYMQSGIQKSMDKVLNFRTDLVDSAFAASADDVSAYIAEATDNYNAATGDDKLNVIVNEYYFALFGNGVEIYNTYRRTGMPYNLQPLLKQDTDKFLRSFYYPEAEVFNNSSIEQKADVYQKVFWDTNPDAGFIN